MSYKNTVRNRVYVNKVLRIKKKERKKQKLTINTGSKLVVTREEKGYEVGKIGEGNYEGIIL